MKNVFILVGFALLISCDPYDTRLTIENRTDEIIFYSISVNDSIRNSSPLVIDNEDTIWTQSSLILPDSVASEVILGRDGWKYFINEDCLDSTLRVFLFDKNLVLETPWDTIYAKQKYLKKYEMSVEDLEKANWRLVYE